MSVEQTDKDSAAVAKGPRVTLADVQGAIARVDYTTAGQAIGQEGPPYSVMTLAFVRMHNGFLVIGKSAPAAPENYNASLGQKLAYEDALHPDRHDGAVGGRGGQTGDAMSHDDPKDNSNLYEIQEDDHHYQRYLRAAHAVQSGVAQMMELRPSYGSAKHSRTGIDMQKAEQGGLAKLLIEKGVFTRQEYTKAMADAMEREQAGFEQELSHLMKANIKLA